MDPMRVGELVDQTRLAHPRFADDRRDLASTVTRTVLGAAELLNLGVATNETRQSPPRACLETGPP
jgi:hypothetical protein